MAVLDVGTYNILHGMRVLNGASEGDPGALSEAVAQLDVDVLGMQEVDLNQPRSSMADQTADAAAALDAGDWRFIPTVVGTPGPDASFRPSEDSDVRAAIDGQATEPMYGVGLISRIPVVRWDHLVMPAAKATLPLLVPGNPRPRFLRVPDEPRAALAAVLDLPTPITVVTAHLSFVPGYNVSQLRRIKRWLVDMPRPLILIGDFNMPGRLPGRVTRWSQAELGPTYPVFRPRIRFDHILSDGIGAQNPQVHALPVSDHCAASARFSL